MTHHNPRLSRRSMFTIAAGSASALALGRVLTGSAHAAAPATKLIPESKLPPGRLVVPGDLKLDPETYKNKVQKQSVSSNEEINSFFVKNKGELIKIELDDIFYLEAFDNYCNLYTSSQKHLITHAKKRGRKVTST